VVAQRPRVGVGRGGVRRGEGGREKPPTRPDPPKNGGDKTRPPFRPTPPPRCLSVTPNRAA
jgi:hypothetical protein